MSRGVVGVMFIRLLWFVLGAIVMFSLYDYRYGTPDCQGLRAWYDHYNELYFDGNLPKDIIIEYASLPPGEMALTDKVGGKFRIRFSRRYNQAAQVAHFSMLHEMCHVEKFDEPDMEGFPRFHGPFWRMCMERLEIKGAYRSIIY
jgi:hypothetical protein